jgi:undecaprenyl-phosphate 4-deoxy-4-formamido-L-arabinose transferase
VTDATLTQGISVVVPVYNDAALLVDLVAAVKATLDGSEDGYEIVLVDDGSSDETWSVIRELAEDERVRALRLTRNYGQHNALLAGIRAARRRITVTIDADLQYPPKYIPELVARLDDSADVVYGTAERRAASARRRLASSFARRVLRTLMGTDVTFSSFRAFRTNLRDGFAHFGGPYVALDVLLSWSTRRFASIPIEHSPRREGRSNYSVSKLVTFGLTMLTGFSTRPLRFASLVGFAFTVVGFGLLIFVLVNFLIEGQVVHGFAFLASIISIFAGAQLFALGIIGEYLARVHMRVLDPPTYTIGEELE